MDFIERTESMNREIDVSHRAQVWKWGLRNKYWKQIKYNITTMMYSDSWPARKPTSQKRKTTNIDDVIYKPHRHHNKNTQINDIT